MISRLLDRPESARSHAAVLAVLIVAIVARHWLHVVTPTALNDEISYLRAIDFVLAGDSPYTRGLYLYPPLLAVVGARFVEMFGVAPFLWTLRALCYLGMAVTVWLTMLSVPWRRWFLPAALAYTVLAPAVTFSIVIHNISPLIAGATLTALWIWPQRPLVAGVLLGVAAVVKPMVALAPALLFLHRPRAEDGRQHRVAGLASGIVAALLLWLPGYLPEMLELASKPATIPRSVSFHRLAHLAGWEGGAIWVSAAIALAAVAIVRRLTLGRLELLIVAVTATLMATPVLWSHTLVLALPIQAMALQRLYRRRTVEATTFPFESVFVILAVAAVQFSGGAGSVDDQGSAFQVFSTLPIALAPAAIAVYLMLTGGWPEPPVRSPAS